MQTKSTISVEVVILIILLLLLDTVAQIFFKIGVTYLGEFPTTSWFNILQYTRQLIFNPFVIAGVAALFFALFCWLTLISKVDLSLAHPMTSLVYITVPIFSTVFLNESLEIKQLLGAILIVIGVFTISQDDALEATN